MEKRIVQYGSLAGWPFLVALGLRKAGYNSVNVIQENSDVNDLDRQLPHDRTLCSKDASRLKKFFQRFRFLIETRRTAALVHYHGAVIMSGRWHHLLEGPLLHNQRIPMLMSFGGGDARIVSEARSKNPYFYRELDEGRDQKIREYLKSISKYIRYVATDCEMMSYVEPYFEKCFVFRQPVNLEIIKFVEPRVDRAPVILHTPTYTWVKGTKYIQAAIERLAAEGHKLEFRLKRQLTQAQMVSEIAACDIYVDELLCGSHGVTAVEAMAAGKPTLTFIRPDLVAQYPSELPIVNANPDTVYDQLKKLISSPELRKDISYRGREYVEKYHDMHVVTDDLMQIYREIGLNSNHLTNQNKE